MKTKITRRGFIGAAATLTTVSTFGIRRASAAPAFEYKYGTNVPVTHPLTARALEAAEKIRKESDGRFELKVFPNNQLGGDTDMLSQVRSGALEFFSVSGVAGLSTVIPAGSMYGIGFAWPDYQTVWRAMDGELGALFRKQINGAGLFVMDRIWNSGFRQITTRSKPIVKPEDLAGLKIRVPISSLWTSMFAALGASPSSINLSEVYSALQTKVVDGQETLLSPSIPRNSMKCRNIALSPTTCGTGTGSSVTVALGNGYRPISKRSLAATSMMLRCCNARISRPSAIP